MDLRSFAPRVQTPGEILPRRHPDPGKALMHEVPSSACQTLQGRSVTAVHIRCFIHRNESMKL